MLCADWLAGWLQGTLGEVIPLPEGLASADSLWTVAAGEDIEHVQLVRWRFALPDGVGQWILLCRVAGEGWTAGWQAGHLHGLLAARPTCCNAAQVLPASVRLDSSALGVLPVALSAPCFLPPASHLHPAEALAFIQHQPAGAPAGTARTAAALAELAASLQLLAAFCTRDPHTGLELLHVELPAGDSPEAGQRGPDLLSLACQTVAVLAQLPEPPTAIIGGWVGAGLSLPVCLQNVCRATSAALEPLPRHVIHLSPFCQPLPQLYPACLPTYPCPAADCLAICAALAEGIPGRVAQELISVCGISPAVAAATPLGQAGEVPLLSRVLGAEGSAGCYPATQAFLRLLTTLVSGGQCGAVLCCAAMVQRDGLWRGRAAGRGVSCAFASALGPFAPSLLALTPSLHPPAHLPWCSRLAGAGAAGAGGVGAAPRAG